MKKLICIILVIVQLISTTAFANSNYAKEYDVPFYVVAENFNDEIEIFGWIRSYTSSTIITLWVGEIDNPIYVKETTVESNGYFSFGFEPSDDISPGKYKFRICSNSEMEVYESYLHYDGKTKEYIEYFFDTSLSIDATQNMPVMYGRISCIRDVTTEFSLVDTKINKTYADYTIVGENGTKFFSFEIPQLTDFCNYEISILCYNKFGTLLDVNFSMSTASIFPMGIDLAVDVFENTGAELEITVDENIYHEWFNFDTSQTFSKDVPNVLYNTTSYIYIAGKKYYEYESNNDVIMFENWNLYHTLRECYPDLDPDLDRIITAQELRSLTGSLDLSNSLISSIVGLEHCENIHTLDISSNDVTDVSRLNELDKLQILYANDNKIESVTRLPKNLKYVDLSNNLITSVENYNEYNSITYFKADDNDISSIGGLSKNLNLKYLNLKNNNITDISPLSSCSKIAHLDVSSNSISDVSPLKNNNVIVYLDLSDNNISDISQLPDIWYNTLNLKNNYISDEDISQFYAAHKAYLPAKQN